jgi:AraC-like DNA-binding protein
LGHTHPNRSLQVLGAPGGGGEITAAVLAGLPSALREAGLDPVEVIASVGVRPGLLDDPDGRLRYCDAARLLERGAALTGREDFGLGVGRLVGLDALGIVGFLARNGRTVADALGGLCRYAALVNQAACPVLTCEAGVATFASAVHEPGVPAFDQVADMTAAVGVNQLRTLCGAGWAPVQIRLARRAPRDAAPYRRQFGIEPRFDAPDTAIAFDAAWLARPVAGADPELRATLEARAASLCAADTRALAQRVRGVVRRALMHRSCSAGRVCAVMSIGYRSLNRRLAAEGTSLAAIIDSVRFDVASQLLVHTDMPMTEIADALDYSDPSAFTRAFARWAGVPPSRWRLERAPVPV